MFFISNKAGVAELVDALDLGSSDFCRVGSSPSARTMLKLMKIEETKKTKDLNIEWKITIKANDINLELDQKYSDIQKELKIPGFRQGKVPLNIIKERYSKSVIPEVTDKIINQMLSKAILERKLRPAVQPRVDVDKYEEGGDMSLLVSFSDNAFEISDIDLKSITLEKSVLKILDTDIQNSLDDIAKNHERFKPLVKKENQLWVT